MSWQRKVLAREGMALGGRDMTAPRIAFPLSYPGRWDSWPLLVAPDSDGDDVLWPEL